MIAKAALEVDVGATWATFLQRKAFMTGHPHFGLILGDDGIRFPPLRGMMASLLFIDAVSIFDAATETQMTKAKHRKLSTFDRRLKVLASEKKLVNAAACHRVRMRRNQVAHKAIEVTENELDQAIAVLHGELQGWGIVGPPPLYDFLAIRSGARASNKAGFSMAYDYEVGVKRGEKWVLKYIFTTDIA